MSQLVRKQDLPPPNGYKPIPFARVPAKTYFGGYAAFAAYIAVTSVSFYIYSLTRDKIKREEVEMRSARMAMYPMLTAERDREFMKQLRRNRDDEAKLMANVEGWVVGTLYGEPVYKTIPKDKFMSPIYHEYYIHAPDKDMMRRMDMRHWS